MTSSTPSIFLSYSHQDERWKDALLKHLRILSRQSPLHLWDDRRITAGDEWRKEIEEAMGSAKVAILLVSVDFLDSEFVNQVEIPRLLERRAKEGVRIVPIIVRPCPWKHVQWLSRFQARPKDGKPLSSGTAHEIDEMLTAIAEEVYEIARNAATTQPASSPPSQVVEKLVEPWEIRPARIEEEVTVSPKHPEEITLSLLKGDKLTGHIEELQGAPFGFFLFDEPNYNSYMDGEFPVTPIDIAWDITEHYFDWRAPKSGDYYLVLSAAGKRNERVISISLRIDS